MSIRKTIEDCCAAYAAGDLEETMKPFAETICFDWPADPDYSKFNGCSNGREEMIDRLTELAGQFEFLKVELVDLIVDGDKAAARVSMRLRSRQSGAEFTNHSGHFWRFEGGMCTELIEFYDTALVRAHAS